MDAEKGKLIRISIGIALIALFGLVIWKLDLLKPEVSQSTSTLAVSPATFDFSEISMAKGNVSTTIMITNEGDDDIKITDIRTSCMCTTATIDGTTFGMHKNPALSIWVKAGEQKSLLVTFDPNAHGPDAVGPISRIVFITTNSTVTPQVEARVTGNVVP